MEEAAVMSVPFAESSSTVLVCVFESENENDPCSTLLSKTMLNGTMLSGTRMLL